MPAAGGRGPADGCRWVRNGEARPTRRKRAASLVLLLAVATVGILAGAWWLLGGPPPAAPPEYTYGVRNAFPNLAFTQPVGIYDAGDGSGRLFVVEQGGLVWQFDNDPGTASKDLFLDASDLISTGGEKGLLGLAFHPNYAANGFIYVYYTMIGVNDARLSRFTVNETDPTIANESSRVTILDVTQPYPNHNGGQIAFGPDGYLYVGLGDGGSGGDPLGHAQNRSTLLGSILRIDVDDGFPYGIPADNPFAGNVNGYKEEIYAFGLRNPWRFSFDDATGTLWAGDVGQGAWEEIDVIEKGGNYGWNAMEGAHPYPGGGPNVTAVVPPVHEYANAGPDIAVTGGFVYRGSRAPGLAGRYVFADYGSGKVWALEYQAGIAASNALLVDSDLLIPSFGVDAAGELYICAYGGSIYELVETPVI
ncbi:MAG: PQQ-dependent sugar dehydrogenase [Candidatus Lokiarchaeota archaeon]|nr:PQQ-dependent sugar dehydrogenase [Candidatus Lokiarchaeota archaeon]